MNRLFVYGIFLDEGNRQHYKMSNPRYDTVLNYATFGRGIVQAQYIPDVGLSLTGLLVDLPDDYDWTSLDALEGGYARVMVTTTSNVIAYMYAMRTNEENQEDKHDTRQRNYSTVSR